MKGIEIVAIGDEILHGVTVNTNAAYISRELDKAGFSVVRHTVLPDDPKTLKRGLKEALSRSDVVITTGGLGPTCDDVSRSVAAELFGSDFYLNEELLAALKKRYGNKPVSLENQATVPRKAKILPNPVGTAPGFMFEPQPPASSGILMMMPGVPPEMRAMLADQVIPALLAAFPPSSRQYVKSLHLMNLPESVVDPELRRLEMEYPAVSFGIYPSLGLLTIHMKCRADNEQQAMAILEQPFQQLSADFELYQFSSPSGTIEEAVHLAFIKKGLTLSIAESCTGGAVAARLTRLPGASKYFLGSLVTYSNELKTRLLGVPAALIKKKGAVSEDVVKAMVAGLLEQTGSDYGIAVSGIAGPDGGTPEKPVGTVWGAICRKNESPRAWKFRGYGNREMIIERCVNALLAELVLAEG